MRARVLLVEDNENNLYLERFLLEREGFLVQTARNGKQALELARRERPHGVVLDILMPEMDGYEMAQHFQRETGLAEIPLIGVSSFVSPAERARALRAGFAAYIEKPINPESFGEEVRRILLDAGVGTTGKERGGSSF